MKKFTDHLTLCTLVVMPLVIMTKAIAAAPYMPPLINHILDHSEELSPLEQVLEAYENPASSHVFIAAHRGGRENDVSDGAPGNSIANIDNALSNGFDLYESDIEILGDDTLIVFHDDHFNDLTNSTVEDDLLDNRDLSYAKSLFLTFTDGSVSNQRIPTLEEFLIAGKDKIMFKFDLKSGTFSGTTLRRIFDTVLATETVDQVLIRGGQNLLETASDGGYDTRMIMRRFNSEPTIDDINALANFDLRAISIPNGASDEVIAAAVSAGLIVEFHESQGTDQERQDSWSMGIEQGVRQFHSFKPEQLKAYLIANGHREF